jgi:hypothetical protein
MMSSPVFLAIKGLSQRLQSSRGCLDSQQCNPSALITDFSLNPQVFDHLMANLPPLL